MGGFEATDWSRYDVPTIADMLTDANAGSWDQASAWRAAADAMDAHQADLAKAVAQLAEAWSPDKSAAAAEFIDYVESLQISVAQTAELAYVNSTALTNVLVALGQARARITDLHRTWQRLASDPVENVPQPHMPARTPVWQTSLNSQAQQVMTETDEIILANTRRLQAPDPFPLGFFDSGGTGHPVQVSTGLPPESATEPASGASLSRVKLSSRKTTLPSVTVISADLGGTSDGVMTAVDLGVGAAGKALAGRGMARITSLREDRPRISGTDNSAPNQSPSGQVDADEASKVVSSKGHVQTDATSTAEISGEEAKSASGPIPLTSGMAGSSTSPTRNRRRRASAGTATSTSSAVSGLIAPCPHIEPVHDPGPAVIGPRR